MAKTFYILDGHAQVYRAFYAPFRDLTSPAGEPTRATFVFCQMLFNLIRQRRPDYLAMAMDVSDRTVFRCEIHKEYKANRDPPPEDLGVQADRIVSIMESLGVPIYRVAGFEADDLLATITERLKGEEIDVYLVSRDKDLEQLISPRVRLYDAHKDQILDAKQLVEKKGFTPEQAVEVQTLAGDSTDNIPGVQGVGVKTAARLINQYGSAEAVLEHADELTPKMCERVKAFAGRLPLTRELVTLRRDVPFEFDLRACALDRLNVAAVRPIFEELGFGRLMEVLDELAHDYPTRGAGSTGALERERSRGLKPAAQSATTSAERGKYELVDTVAKLDTFVSNLSKQRCFAFDTETTGLNPVSAELVGLSFCWQAGQACYLPVRAAMGTVLPVEAVVEKLRPIFEDPSIAKVGQNLKYDMLVLRQVGIVVAGAAFDTMLASFLLDPGRQSHSLDALVRALLGHQMIPITDLIGKGKNQITIDQVDTDRVGEYAAEDADFTWRLYEILEPQIAGSHVEELFRDTEMPLVEVLVEMEHNGISLDEGLLGSLSRSMGKRLGELTCKVHVAAGREFNIDSTKQLANVLFDEQGLDVVRKTKTGRSTDADTLSTLVAQTDHTIPKLVLEYRELSKLKNTYLDTLPKMVCRRTGRVHASFNQTGAITGRLSSSDPNLQNIPIRTETGRQIRAAVIAGKPDCVLLTADYSQIELRLLAHFCEDEALLDAFREGQDIHRRVAAEVNGVSLDEVTAEQRSAAKAVNFGIIYGQSPFGLSRSLGIPVGEAKAFIDTYFMRYPGIRLFIDKCVADAKRQGYAETILGRRRPVPELKSRNRQQVSLGERIAVNTVVQGSAADLIKRAMIDIHRELQTDKHSARMLIQVHDELVFEVPEQAVEAEAKMIRKKMEQAIDLRVPIVADVAWGKTWAEGK
ncbi:MAG: DNA polymerase I [Planctomycetota bacterium]|jgi:DNA polymerase-1